MCVCVCVSVCVCVCVCLSVRMIEPKRLKLQSPISVTGLSPSSVLAVATYLLLDQKVKGQASRSHGHKVQKHTSVEGDPVADVSLHSIGCPSSIVYFCTIFILIIIIIIIVLDFGSF